MNTQEREDNALIPLYTKREIALIRGNGAFVIDEDGKKYLDLCGQYGAVILGYNHPVFTAAIQKQVAKIQSCHSSFYTSERAKLAEKLVEVMNTASAKSAPLTKSFFSSTGAEAVEAALKFARVTSGKIEVIATNMAYHGRTFGALSATGNQKHRQPFEPLIPGFTHVPFNDFDALKKAVSEETAAIILEPIQGEAGVYEAEKEYFQKVRVWCDEREILLIFDEVQTGVGRTGKWCAFHHFGVRPDILCLSKGLGNGIPVAATMVTEEVAKRIPRGAHGTTFGGNPLSCAAALTVIDIIEKENLLSHVTDLGNHVIDTLRAKDIAAIREIRGRGAMIGIELKTKVGKYLKKLQQEGFLVIPAGNTTLRLLFPYVTPQEELDRFLSTLSHVL